MGDGNKEGGAPGDDAWASLNESDDWHGLDAGKPAERGDPPAPPGAPPGLSLVVTAGPELGRTYAIHGARTTVGRGKNNDIQLSDASISREHARLEKRQGGVFVVDLQSGNGTFIEQERVSQAALRVGQTVGFGHVRLQLRGPRDSAVPRAAAAGAPVATAGPPAAGARVAATGAPPARPTRGALARGGWRQLRARWPRGRARLALAAAVAVGLCSVYWRHHRARAQAFAAVQAGMVAYAEHRWDAAEQAFITAEQLVAHYELPTRWLRALSRARHDESTLADIKEALRKGDLVRARSWLNGLRDSPLLEQAVQLEAQWREAGHARMLAAEAALQAHLPHEAEALLSQLDSGHAPRPDRVALLAWQRRQSELEPLAAEAATFASKPKPAASLWEQAASQSPAMRAGLQAFRGHRAAEAPALARRALGSPRTNEERRLLSDFGEFEGLWDAGLEEHRGKRAFAAIKLFAQAKELSARLVGPQSGPRRDLDAKLADMYYVVGMQSLAAGKLVESAEALRAALQLQPNHALSRKGMDELTERAQRMVDEAEFVRVSRPPRAKELLRQVAAILPASHRLGGRARKLLATL